MPIYLILLSLSLYKIPPLHGILGGISYKEIESPHPPPSRNTVNLFRKAYKTSLKLVKIIQGKNVLGVSNYK